MLLPIFAKSTRNRTCLTGVWPGVDGRRNGMRVILRAAMLSSPQAGWTTPLAAGT